MLNYLSKTEGRADKTWNTYLASAPETDCSSLLLRPDLAKYLGEASEVGETEFCILWAQETHADTDW